MSISPLRGIYQEGLTLERGSKERLQFTQPVIEAFLRARQVEGTSRGMQYRYALALKSLQRYLQSRKYLVHSDLRRWQHRSIQAGYSRNTVNCMTGAVNTFLVYAGRAEWRLPLLSVSRKSMKQEKPG